MERTLQELERRLYALEGSLKSILKYADYENYYDLSGIDYDPRDPDQRLLAHEFRRILDRLEGVQCTLAYLKRPKKAPLPLYKNSRGRYETESREYTSGSGIEYLQEMEAWPDGEPETVKEWKISRIEHNGQDYYIVANGATPLEGLLVRERGE
jgi:hypothetical protein